MSHISKGNENSEDEERIGLRFIKLAVGTFFLVIALILEKRAVSAYVFLFFYGCSYCILAWGVLKEALENLFHGQLFDENFLMTVATVAAVALGEYKEAVSVMLFYMIGETAQDFAVDKSRKNIGKAMDIIPEIARVVEGNSTVLVEPSELKEGQIVRVLAGERVPADGVIISGTCSVDNSALTGESLPVTLEKGMEILSGSIVLDSAVDFKCTKEYCNSTVSRILKLVEESQDNKAPQEKFITKFAKVYTPAVVFSAIVLALVPSVITGNWSLWIHRALSFLVISCPCALVLSVPLAFFAGIGGLAAKGIVVKGANYLETLSKVRTFAFDKTGTLTQGKPQVKKADSEKSSLLFGLGLKLEELSNHPLAGIVMEYCKSRVQQELDINVAEFSETAGQGIKAKVFIAGKTHQAFCGNRRLMAENGININIHENKEFSTVYVALDKEIEGVFYIQDTVKEGASEVIRAIKKLGIQKTVLLSGDNSKSANFIAAELEIDETFGELLPEDKVEKMREIKKNSVTAYIGDGINDAPVLAVSDVGISMGTIGSDSAVEASGIVLIEDDLKKIPLALKSSVKTVRIAHQNIIFAIAVKAVCLVLGSLGLGTMALAVFADTGVALLCVLNSLRAMSV